MSDNSPTPQEPSTEIQSTTGKRVVSLLQEALNLFADLSWHHREQDLIAFRIRDFLKKVRPDYFRPYKVCRTCHHPRSCHVDVNVREVERPDCPSCESDCTHFEEMS